MTRGLSSYKGTYGAWVVRDLGKRYVSAVECI